jgi:hypothetical protein
MSLKQINNNNGLTVASYAGDGTVLLAFDIDKNKTQNFAGFAVEVVTPDKGSYPSNKYWLKNRISFKGGLTSKTALTPDLWVESNKAPFQTFHWVHFPGAGEGKYIYNVYPCYFKMDE